MKKIEKIERKEEKLWLPASMVIIFLLFWGYLVLKNYYPKFPVNLGQLSWIFSLDRYPNFGNSEGIKIWFEHLFLLLLNVWLLSVSFALGRRIFKWSNLEFNSPLEEFIFSSGIGLGVLIFLVFFLGIFGFLYRSVSFVFLFFFSVLTFFELKDFSRERREIPSLKIKLNFWQIVLVSILGVNILSNLIGSLSPELFYDSLNSYLALPKLYILEHQIVRLVNHSVSHHPANMSMLYLTALLIKNSSVLAKLVHFSLGILSILGIYAFCRRYFTAQIGLLAAAFFYSIPMVAINTTACSLDVGMTFFQMLALYAMINFFTEKKTKWLILSGLFSGLIMGVRYTGIFFVLGLFYLLGIKKLFLDKEQIAIKEKFKIILQQVTIYGLVTSFVLSPWLIKNFIFTGNPVHYYLGNIFGVVGVNEEKVKMSLAETRVIGEKTLKDYLLLPWKLTMKDASNANFPGPIFLIFLPLILFFRKIDQRQKYLLIYFGLSCLFWIPITRVLRYFTPGLAILAIIIAYYIFQDKLLNKIILPLAVILTLYNTYWSVVMVMHPMNNDPLGVVLGLESKRDYLSRLHPGYYPNPYYPVIEYANRTLPKEAKILFLGEARGYYSERPFVTSLVDNLTPVIEWAKISSNAEEFYQKIKKEKITHILFNAPEARRLSGYDVLYWEGEDLKVFLEFWNKYVKEIYKDIADISLPHQGIYSMKRQVPNWWQQYARDPKNYIYLYEILTSEEAEKSHSPPLNFFLMPEFYSKERWEKIRRYFHSNG